MRMMKNVFFFLLCMIATAVSQDDVKEYYNGKLIEGRAVWANPKTVARNDSMVQDFVLKCKQANIHLIVLLVAQNDQAVYYHSKKFQSSIDPNFADFDPLAAIVREAHQQGIRVHAWVCDFTQSANGPIMKTHPEWAVRNPDGKIPTEVEYLGGGRKYFINWMCPARRPGYTDMWLLPMIEEIVRNYQVDGIHHDYVRYPGDVAPDSYCFCDYCLEEMLKYAHLYYESFPDTVFAATPTLPNFVANWWSDPTVRPADWEKWDRKKKAAFFLNGSFMKGGPTDLDYFFYTYRQDAIKRFAKEAWETASAINPDIQISAAVFKNPIASGRFIGQRWTDFAPWVDLMMPMIYRSHFPDTDFPTFLTLLAEFTRYEVKWAEDKTHLSIGLDVHYLYNEERLFLSESIAALDSLRSGASRQSSHWQELIRNRFSKVKEHLATVIPDTAARVTALMNRLETLSATEINELQQILKSINRDPPAHYYPEEKLRKAIATVRNAGAKGIVIFDGYGLTHRKLWPTLADIFAEPSIDPEEIQPAAEMSILTLKALRNDVKTTTRWLWIFGSVALILLILLAWLLKQKVQIRNSGN